MPEFLTEAEAAELARCSAKTLSRRRASGELPFMKFGGGIRYRREHILALLRDGAPAPAGAGKSWTPSRWTEDAQELPAGFTRAPSRRAVG
jgi:excisionase family DNA binding protein